MELDSILKFYNVGNNRDNLRNFLLVTNNIGKNIQENFDAVVFDGRLNDAMVWHALDLTVH